MAIALDPPTSLPNFSTLFGNLVQDCRIDKLVVGSLQHCQLIDIRQPCAPFYRLAVRGKYF
jgi:hypothetical protein